MRRLCALAVGCVLLGGIALIGCSKAPDEKLDGKPAADAAQANTAKKSPAKGSMTDSAGP